MITHNQICFNGAVSIALDHARQGNSELAIHWACRALGYANRMKDREKARLLLSAINHGRMAARHQHDASIKAAWLGESR